LQVESENAATNRGGEEQVPTGLSVNVSEALLGLRDVESRLNLRCFFFFGEYLSFEEYDV